jgi:hypothetical protein
MRRTPSVELPLPDQPLLLESLEDEEKSDFEKVSERYDAPAQLLFAIMSEPAVIFECQRTASRLTLVLSLVVHIASLFMVSLCDPISMFITRVAEGLVNCFVCFTFYQCLVLRKSFLDQSDTPKVLRARTSILSGYITISLVSVTIMSIFLTTSRLDRLRNGKEDNRADYSHASSLLVLLTLVLQNLATHLPSQNSDQYKHLFSKMDMKDVHVNFHWCLVVFSFVALMMCVKNGADMRLFGCSFYFLLRVSVLCCARSFDTHQRSCHELSVASTFIAILVLRLESKSSDELPHLFCRY